MMIDVADQLFGQWFVGESDEELHPVIESTSLLIFRGNSLVKILNDLDEATHYL